MYPRTNRMGMNINQPNNIRNDNYTTLPQLSMLNKKQSAPPPAPLPAPPPIDYSIKKIYIFEFL